MQELNAFFVRLSSNLKILLRPMGLLLLDRKLDLVAGVYSKGTQECGFEGCDLARVYSMHL
ncbi:MAG TPA: hypothetical protein VIK72_15350 [Clostridiaceae bacterium]